MHRLIVIICAMVGISWVTHLSAQPSAQSKSSQKRSTVYSFETEELTGKGKGPNNVFLKVGEMKKRKLLQMRPHFRPELRRSLQLVK